MLFDNHQTKPSYAIHARVPIDIKTFVKIFSSVSCTFFSIALYYINVNSAFIAFYQVIVCKCFIVAVTVVRIFDVFFLSLSLSSSSSCLFKTLVFLLSAQYFFFLLFICSPSYFSSCSFSFQSYLQQITWGSFRFIRLRTLAPLERHI